MLIGFIACFIDERPPEMLSQPKKQKDPDCSGPLAGSSRGPKDWMLNGILTHFHLLRLFARNIGISPYRAFRTHDFAGDSRHRWHLKRDSISRSGDGGRTLRPPSLLDKWINNGVVSVLAMGDIKLQTGQGPERHIKRIARRHL